MTIRFEALLEVDYISKFEEEKRIQGGAMYSHTAAHYVLLDGSYLGDCDSLQQRLVDCGLEETEADIIEDMQSVTRETSKCMGKISTVFLGFSYRDPLDKATERTYDKKLTIQL